MNFRSFARSVLDALDFRKKPGDGESAPAPKKERRAPAFSRGAGGDGFEAGGRGTPVDLTGGVKRRYEVTEELIPPPAPPPTDFVASLDDLGALMETVDQALPEPIAPEGFELQPYGPEPQDAFEAVAAPMNETVDSFEAALPMDDGPIDSFEPAPPMAVAPPAAVVPAQPVAVEQPVPAPAPAPAPVVAAPQHTVALLMAIAREPAPRAEVAEQFSTLELFDMVAQLSGAEEPPPVANPPGVEATAEAAPTTVPSGEQRVAAVEPGPTMTPRAEDAPTMEPPAIQPAVVGAAAVVEPATVAVRSTAERALTTEPLAQPAAVAGVTPAQAPMPRNEPVVASAAPPVTPVEGAPTSEPVIAPAEVPAPPSQAAATPAAVVEPAPASTAGPTQPHITTAPAAAEPAQTTIQSADQPVAAEQPGVTKVTPAADADADPTPK